MVGSTIYLNGNPDLSVALSRIEGNGGKILATKMNIGGHGNIAFFLATEGNKVGLHSIK
ncbi:MAG: putative enzyme related to lactoylglutathione lyase [Sphingobacteriales bacterium]|jgi:predicted enzyme related to lactoylglutathione lyase